MLKPDIIFEVSWEVCNKVGGIYTVLSSRAHTLMKKVGQEKLIFLGPDLTEIGGNPDFIEDNKVLPQWKTAAEKEGLKVRIGYWDVEGHPIAVLLDFSPFYADKNKIYAEAWEYFHVDSLEAYGDYDESSMFSYACGRFVEILYRSQLLAGCKNIIFQAHEWMSGLGMLYINKHVPEIATIFTTHATTVGRSITTNNKQLYKYFKGYNGDQMSHELHVEAKHSVEKQSALHADCFTTVSQFTDTECAQLLDKAADIVLPNGFDDDVVPRSTAKTKLKKAARERIIKVASAMFGEKINANALIVSTSGRNDFRCKGYDVFLQSVQQLNYNLKAEGIDKTKVIALLEVPCWVKEPRKDLIERLESECQANEPLPQPFSTHTLYNENEDAILSTMRALNIQNTSNDPVKVLLLPCYFDGNDGVINMTYYDALCCNDLCIYPSYYEPWGYTPLEACAFSIPCITTDLSGFGQWVNSLLGSKGNIENGVEVIHRDDDNYWEVVNQMTATMHHMLQCKKSERNKMGKNAKLIAKQAQWKKFIAFYLKAYDFALKNRNK